MASYLAAQLRIVLPDVQHSNMTTMLTENSPGSMSTVSLTESKLGRMLSLLRTRLTTRPKATLTELVRRRG